MLGSLSTGDHLATPAAVWLKPPPFSFTLPTTRYCFNQTAPAVTRGLRFSGLIRRIAPFSHLLRYTRGCEGSILTRIFGVVRAFVLVWVFFFGWKVKKIWAIFSMIIDIEILIRIYHFMFIHESKPRFICLLVFFIFIFCCCCCCCCLFFFGLINLKVWKLIKTVITLKHVDYNKVYSKMFSINIDMTSSTP
jgi:hypothetical protein